MLYNECKIRKCLIEDIDNIMELQKQIIADLDDKTILRENNRDMLTLCVQNSNLSLGVFNENEEMIALAIFCDANGTAEDISQCLVNHTVDVSANVKLILVRKDYRWKGLQKSLMWIIEKYAANSGYTHLCVTASPNNKYSVSNIENMGYQYDHTQEKYGGLLRNVYVKDIAISVQEYNKKMIQNAYYLEGLDDKELILNNIDLNKFIKGNIELATTGDILVYEDEISNELYYCLFIKKVVPFIIIYNEEKSAFQIKEYNIKIANMVLKYVLHNTIRI